MTTYRTAAETAQAAAEAVRTLNHLTLARPGSPDAIRAEWESPADAYAVAGALAELVQRLPQAVRQTARLITTLHNDGLLRHDSGDGELLPAQVAAVSAGAAETCEWLGDATGSLRDLHTALGPLGWLCAGDWDQEWDGGEAS